MNAKVKPCGYRRHLDRHPSDLRNCLIKELRHLLDIEIVPRGDLFPLSVETGYCDQTDQNALLGH